MQDKRIDFQNIPWTKNKGSKVKAFHGGKFGIRIVEFDENFMEETWCEKGHIGYVLEGEMNINFDGLITEYKKGDGIYILTDTESRHKAIIAKGKYVRLLLVEKIN